MHGHCWEIGRYDTAKFCYDTTLVRMLYGVWRDRGALAEKAERDPLSQALNEGDGVYRP